MVESESRQVFLWESPFSPVTNLIPKMSPFSPHLFNFIRPSVGVSRYPCIAQTGLYLSSSVRGIIVYFSNIHIYFDVPIICLSNNFVNSINDIYV